MPFDLSFLNWFVLHVRVNQEKRTAQRLASSAVEYFLPCYRSLRQWKDRRVTLEMPLFPGYVFVHIDPADRMKVLTLPNVVGLVGSRNFPSIVSPEEIDRIRRGVEFGNAAPHPAFAVGQRVLITEGALQGMSGCLLRNGNNTRVVISIDSIARSFVVDVDITCLKSAGAISPQERKAV
ncbi:MAG TPA: UpxY family transcription antiterminator [Candidatus Angelobacter sp.]|nr:UpxY family transcription antiterminator [Candidatus Angelobacter sp.]